jgi:FKBP-type peptidyl-prolyl cis-trans isomerase 2
MNRFSNYKIYLIIAVLLCADCASAFAKKAPVIRRGSTVIYHYTVSVDGVEVDSTKGGEPVQYIQGKKMILPELEKALSGMAAGETKTVTIKAPYAYGNFDEDNIVKFPKQQMPEGVQLQKGMIIKATTDEGLEMAGVYLGANDDSVFVNFNHPLAGMDLNFDVTIVDVHN